jgi:hypothetical protein
MRVICRVDNPESDNWRGSVFEVLGDPQRPDVAIAGHYGSLRIDGGFPEEVRNYQVTRLPAALSEEECSSLLRDGSTRSAQSYDDYNGWRRREGPGLMRFRSIVCRTADPVVGTYCRRRRHYVRDGTGIVAEARRRGNQCLFGGWVIPMLAATSIQRHLQASIREPTGWRYRGNGDRSDRPDHWRRFCMKA